MKIKAKKRFLIFLFIFLIACDSAKDSPLAKSPESASNNKVIAKNLEEVSKVPDPSASACASCHQNEYKDWLSSQHAVANRLVDSEKDKAAFTNNQKRVHGDVETTFLIQDGKPVVRQSISGNIQNLYPQAVIGVFPEYQYLIPLENGRLQVLDEAYDPIKNEWFNVFGEEVRSAQEWGHWRNRGNNWNSQCAFCHMTNLKKNYSPETDTYNTTWSAMGISCAQCHGDMSAHIDNPKLKSQSPTKDTSKVMDNCASCHSRREELTGDFKPGDIYHDHFRLSLADIPGVYYPDGQQREENFIHSSFMFSRMGHKGITCQDCHNSHSGKLKITLENNQLCMSCHSTPGSRGAIPIDPKTHTHHDLNSAGSSCVDCHMPKRTYMQRDPRRDHLFVIPDPQLSKELGVPNACNQCHTDKTNDWAIEWTDKWYGEKMDRSSRTRARLVARAQEGDATVIHELLDFIKKEEIELWRATLAALLKPWAAIPEVSAYFKDALKDPSPRIRSVAIEALEQLPEMQTSLKELRNDTSRLVRIDAMNATVTAGEEKSEAYSELLKYLNNMSDQPTGLLKQIQVYLKQGRNQEAETLMQKVIAWDPSAVSYSMLGELLHINSKNPEAIQAYLSANKLEPQNPDYPYAISLLYAEISQITEAVKWLEKTVALEPRFGRAWYNLGLAYSQQNNITKAVFALTEAGKYLNTPEIPYALATIYLQKGDSKNAQLFAIRSLEIDTNFQPARELLRALQTKK